MVARNLKIQFVGGGYKQYLYLVYMWFLLFIFASLSFASTFNQLSFSGGGAYGAVEIGIIKRLIERKQNPVYDLYTGISAGALNAGFLSYYDNIHEGVRIAETIYSSLKNREIYSVLPTTGMSILNTEPLKKTLNAVLEQIDSHPTILTLIGATNLYSGSLDIYEFDSAISDEARVNLLMASSAIPVMFPPIMYEGQLYADGGVISNELLLVDTPCTVDYVNITYITPYQGEIYDNTPLTTTKEILERTIKIIYTNFNNPLAQINQNCINPIGEINQYYVESEILAGYSMLDFDKGTELIKIGYDNVKHRRYNIC